jgi:hypothetical protein
MPASVTTKYRLAYLVKLLSTDFAYPGMPHIKNILCIVLPLIYGVTLFTAGMLYWSCGSKRLSAHFTGKGMRRDTDILASTYCLTYLILIPFTAFPATGYPFTNLFEFLSADFTYCFHPQKPLTWIPFIKIFLSIRMEIIIKY